MPSRMVLRLCRRSFSCLFAVRVYCIGQACQTKDWSLHKRECIALQRWSASAPSADVSIPNDAVRCIARILWTSQKKGVNSLWVRALSVTRIRFSEKGTESTDTIHAVASVCTF